MSEAINKVAKDLLSKFEFGNVQDISTISTKMKQLMTVAETDENFEALFRVKLKKEPVKAPYLVVSIAESLQAMAKNSDEESQAKLITSNIVAALGECMLRRNVSDLSNFLDDTIVTNETKKSMALALSEIKTDFGAYVACLQSEDKAHSSLINAIALEIDDVKTLAQCGKENLAHGRVSEFKELQSRVERLGDYDTMYRIFVEVASQQAEKGVSDGLINQFNDALLEETENKLPHLSMDTINTSVSHVIDLVSDSINGSGKTEKTERLEALKTLKYDILIELGAKATQESMTEEEHERVDRMIDSMETKLRF